MNRRALMVIALAAAAWLGSPAQVNAAGTHDDSFSKEGLLKADVSTLKDMQLVATPDGPLKADQNVLWCGTLQLAWNEAIKLVGEKLQFVNQPPEVDWLNQEDFTSADLDPASYVALADFEKNNVEDEIRAALQKTFGGAASPELIPDKPPHPGPDDFTAYAYLYKNLAFEHPFEKNDPLAFDGHEVKNFGFTKDKNRLDSAVFSQVQIADYKSPDDFVIKLLTKSSDDDLILAKVTPGATLQETIADVLKRIDAAKGNYDVPGTRDDLAVPMLNFDLRGDFPELEHLVLKPGPNAKVKNLETSSVKQLVRFQLNEKGAILKSEAAIQFTATAMMNEPPPYELIFDKPFLILMKQAKSDRPYFALWIGNASLLMPAKK